MASKLDEKKIHLLTTLTPVIFPVNLPDFLFLQIIYILEDISNVHTLLKQNNR